MIRENLSGLVLAGVLAVNPISNVAAHPLSPALATEANVITVQGGQDPTKTAVNIAGGSETTCKTSANKSTTLLLGSESGWNDTFWEFGKGSEPSAGVEADLNVTIPRTSGQALFVRNGPRPLSCPATRGRVSKV